MRSGIFSRRCFALLLVLAFAIWCLPGLSAQTPPSSGPTTPLQQQQLSNLLSIMLTIKQLSLLLGNDLTTWPLQISALEAISEQQDLRLQKSDQQIESSQADLKASEAARLQQSGELAKSQTSLTAESQSFEAYKQGAEAVQSDLQAQIAQERASSLKWKIGGSVLIVAVAVFGGYEGGRALRWW